MDKRQTNPSLSIQDTVSLYDRLAQLKNKLNMDFETMSALLRVLGAGVLVCALSIFLFKDWQHGDDISRYAMLLGFSVLLALTGLICGRWIQDGKGARLFLSLGLLSVPINFIVLGALIYSQWQLDPMASSYPSPMLWQSPDLNSTLMVTGLAWGLLAAVSWLGFRVLAPRSVTPLTVAFLVNCTLLLAPVRGSVIITGLAVVMIWVIVDALRKRCSNDQTLSTREGTYARVIQALPLVLLLGRAMVLYGLNSWMHAVIALTVYIGLRQLAQVLDSSKAWRQRLETVSVWPALIASWFIGEIITTLGTPDILILPAIVMIFSGMMLELSGKCAGPGLRYRWFGVIALVSGMAVNLFAAPQIETAVLCALSGMAVMVFGFCHKQIGMIALGALNLVLGVGFLVDDAIRILDLSGWGSLGAIGILSILAGSLLERYGLQWKTRLQQWRVSQASRA